MCRRPILFLVDSKYTVENIGEGGSSNFCQNPLGSMFFGQNFVGVHEFWVCIFIEKVFFANLPGGPTMSWPLNPLRPLMVSYIAAQKTRYNCNCFIIFTTSNLQLYNISQPQRYICRIFYNLKVTAVEYFTTLKLQL